MKWLRYLGALAIALVLSLLIVPKAWAFCGFYVAKADSKLYNQASQVAIARSGDRTVLTMANDYQGEVKDFAMVVPVPTVITEKDVRVTDLKIMERLDAFSSPRLVEYFDPDPCAQPKLYESDMMKRAPMAQAAPAPMASRRRNDLGVTIESKFSVGEYDILVLSAKESNGLETWLQQNGYKTPKGAAPLLKPYIRQKMKFFVAKVNLEKFDSSGFSNLRPLQISYASPRFMLPIRLGMVNAKDAQDLIVYILSPKGRAEVTNYRTVQVPSNTEVPEFVKSEFGDFYKSMFNTSYDKEDRRVAFLEHAWDMAGCDPCSAEPLNLEEQKQAGVFWLPNANEQMRGEYPRVFLTRLHVRYTRDRFPEDLMFQSTNNQESFQGRYVMNHPFMGETKCDRGRQYTRELPARLEKEAQNVAKLTGWNIQDVRKKLPKVDLSGLTWLDRFRMGLFAR
jgi:hypothetical protein